MNAPAILYELTEKGSRMGGRGSSVLARMEVGIAIAVEGEVAVRERERLG